MIIINYRVTSFGAFSFSMDRSQPHKKGLHICGFLYSLDSVRKSVRSYLGHDQFSLVLNP
jgi:hypothetical protein